MSRFRMRHGLALVLGLLASAGAMGQADYYDLAPRQVAANTYVLLGAQENFSFENHGAISNTGFIVTDDGVVVIDTGPSRLYGEAMRAAIADVTDQPVVQVYITHAHPDHFLGSNAFEDVPIAALPQTTEAIREIGTDLASNLYNLVGSAMRGTTAVVPTAKADTEHRVAFGAHELELIAARGHTAGDLMVFDHSTGVLFAGDIAFHGRAPTTPNADIAAWHETLAATQQRDFKTLVPGHGPVVEGGEALAQTADYLTWLVQGFEQAAARGASAAEVMFMPLPDRWAALAVEPGEYRRSVSHLYPAIERAALEGDDTP
ncbi:quinoprotein relay system zinc metallohydrolase 1 [Endozoicomonas sp. G2_2]|uniref:quinoprotein relay system zinc metallohydrolase 1 n=1 Tax=Endozoicomonas sp. G2_2 TaxID=2821092 RepID=UPI001ADD5404|nr:quinoprotein relay system zinc metallohydrolase 1 [Endozoicomonas sp. G2_2]MBO9468548.1 quinoprotein relay system zinc metallohydrolase 1 [Endozoicomonas sp. G2_2]